MGQSVLAADKKPLTKEESAKVIEAAIRKELNKPKGELTKGDLEKVWRLVLFATELSDVGLKEVSKMKQLKVLGLVDNKITKAGVAQLKKALPKCIILSIPKK